MNYKEFNKLLNIANRSINNASLAAAESDFAFRRLAIAKLVECQRALAEVREILIKNAPQVEYHYDESRKPTEFMEDINSMVRQSKNLELDDDISAAISVLESALLLEPPPLPYENIEREIARLRCRTDEQDPGH